MISFLNVTNKSKLYNETVEETNNFELMNEIKRLRNELENKNKENEDLKALNVKILNIAKNLDKSNNELKSKIDNLQLDLDKKSEIIINQN